MNVKEWPVYLNDNMAITCYYAGCPDDEFDNPGRRSTVGELHEVIIDHALKAHGIELEP